MRIGKIQWYFAMFYNNHIKFVCKMTLQSIKRAVVKPYSRKIGYFQQVTGQKAAEGQQFALGQVPGAACKKPFDIQKPLYGRSAEYGVVLAAKILRLSIAFADGKHPRVLIHKLLYLRAGVQVVDCQIFGLRSQKVPG